MGARHNRKRTRSRPRNRIPQSATHIPRSFSISSTPSTSSLSSSDSFEQPRALLSRQDAMHWQNQWDQWHNRDRQQQQQPQTSAAAMRRQREQAEAQAAEFHRQRIFGGETGDEVSLCAPMLQVVIGLFGGVDYEDP